MKKSLIALGLVASNFICSCKNDVVKSESVTEFSQSSHMITSADIKNDTITVGSDAFLKTPYGRFGMYIDNSGDVIVNKIEDRYLNNGYPHNDGMFDLALNKGDVFESNTVRYYTINGSYDPQYRVHAFRVVPIPSLLPIQSSSF